MNSDLLLEVIGQADTQTLQCAIGDAFRVSVFAHANLGDFTVRLHQVALASAPSNIEIAQSLARVGVSVIAARRSIAA